MRLLCAYTTRLVSGWPMSRGQARCGSCQCLRERAPTRGLRKGAAANFNPFPTLLNCSSTGSGATP